MQRQLEFERERYRALEHLVRRQQVRDVSLLSPSEQDFADVVEREYRPAHKVWD